MGPSISAADILMSTKALGCGNIAPTTWPFARYWPFLPRLAIKTWKWFPIDIKTTLFSKATLYFSYNEFSGCKTRNVRGAAVKSIITWDSGGKATVRARGSFGDFFGGVVYYKRAVNGTNFWEALRRERRTIATGKPSSVSTSHDRSQVESTNRSQKSHLEMTRAARVLLKMNSSCATQFRILPTSEIIPDVFNWLFWTSTVSITGPWHTYARISGDNKDWIMKF